MKKRTKPVEYIVVHCSATKAGQDFRAKDIKSWHLQRGFEDIGYHYVVDLDGTIEVGRDESLIGAHTAGYNDRSIGVCYIGGYDSDTRTKEQKEALLELLFDLWVVHPRCKVVGHRDLSPDRNGDGKITRDEWIKLCPCFDAAEEYSDVNLVRYGFSTL